MRRPTLVTAAVLLLAGPSVASPQSVAPADSARFPCAHIPVHRQFDFWVGTWDVFPWAAPVGTVPAIGQNIIAPILRHCALLEQWTDARGGTGQSYNWWDQNLRTWRQLWIADGGGTLDYSQGEFRDGAMRFSGWSRRPDGRRVEQRLTFFALHADTVRQLFEASVDSGRTWQPNFDGRYIRRKGTLPRATP